MGNKKVLILAYFYPPKNDMGALRPTKMAKYLSAFGWDPIVLTAAGEKRDSGLEAVPGVPVYRTPSVFSFINPLFRESDRLGYWKYGGEKALEIRGETPFDLIYSTAGPMRINFLASKIKDATGVPWVAEFRDPWTDNHFDVGKSRLHFWWTDMKERRAMRNVDVITTVSRPWVELIARRHKGEKNVEFIPNGFDHEDYEQIAKAAPLKKFTVTYTGGLYSRGKHAAVQDPSLFLNAMRLLKDNGTINRDNFCLRFFGSSRDYIEEQARIRKVDDLVEIHDRVPYEESIKKQMESTVLLLLSNTLPTMKAVYTGKVYEYLGARRPILVIPRNEGSVIEALIEETGAGVLCSTVQETACALEKWVTQFYSGGVLHCPKQEIDLTPYTWKDQTRCFASLFNKVFQSQS